MTERMGQPSMEIFRPITFPLNCATVCEILGIVKSTLLRWEGSLGLEVARDESKGQNDRCFSPSNLTKLLIYAKSLTRKGTGNVPVPCYPWLSDFDPTKPCIIDTPSGYHIKYGE